MLTMNNSNCDERPTVFVLEKRVTELEGKIEKLTLSIENRNCILLLRTSENIQTISMLEDKMGDLQERLEKIENRSK